MFSSAQSLSPSVAARRLGVSTKALRLYEQRGLLAPARTAAGWRVYDPDDMARATEIAALRSLGLGLDQVGRVLGRDARHLEPALAMHQAELEERMRDLATTLAKLRELRSGLSKGEGPAAAELAGVWQTRKEITVAFGLPWPWGGERFELRGIQAITYIVGPLGSGKTRLAQRIAEALPDASFLGLDRSATGGARSGADPFVGARCSKTIGRLVATGAVVSDALLALVTALESDGPDILVVDMVEQGLDKATQEALMAYLRCRGPGCRPLFLLTRSSAILDLKAVGQGEAIILCPANHSPPLRVAPYPGTPGFEAVATCLASPEVRARTQGTVAWRPEVGSSA